MSREKAIELLKKENVRLKAENANFLEKLNSQNPPCSPACYHHQSHPCEKCGRWNGYLPGVWKVEQLQAMQSRAEAAESDWQACEAELKAKEEIISRISPDIIKSIEQSLKGK